MKQNLLFLFCVLNTLLMTGQIKGSIVDQNKQALPFVNIYLENTFTGTTSNLEGRYELNIQKPDSYTVVFQFLGYKTLKKTVDIDSFPFQLDVTMIDEEISLDEVIINSEDNPADAIIKKAIANRQQNLETIQSYTADYYSRGLLKIKDAPESILGQDVGDLGGGLDSTRSGVIYLSETVSKLEFLRPDKLNEQIIASKVSGSDNGFSFNNANDVNFNLYNNTIELGNQIISPIANNALSYYKYRLDGIFYDDKGHLINKIEVLPKRKNDPIFSGYIYIVEDQWTFYALELNITGAQARISAADLITIKQNFSYSETDSIWALISQNIFFKYGFLGFKGEGNYIATYSNYNFNSGLSKADFGAEIVSFADGANKKDSTYWKRLRPVPLTDEEISDYIRKDSIQIVRDSKFYKDSIDGVNNRLKFGNFISGYNYSNSYKNWNAGLTSPISTFTFNTVQGWNANVNAYFRKNYDGFNRYLSFNTTFNYGFGDDRLRLMGSVSYKFNNISRPIIALSGGVITPQFNSSEPISKIVNTVHSLLDEKNYMKIYENHFAQIAYSDEIWNGVRINTSFGYQKRQPLYNTTDQVWYPKKNRSYSSNNPLNPNDYSTAPFKTHDILKFTFDARFNFGQKYLSYPDNKINIPNSKFPTVLLGFEKGIGSSISDYNFDQFKFRMTQSLSVMDMGRFQYNFKAGTFLNGDTIAFMDYQHFNGNQTHIGFGSYLNVFNNLPYYAASTNDSYLELHTEHDFGGFILGKIPLLNKLNFNLILGAHALATPDNKPYQEYSVGIDNIGWGKFRFLRLDYVRSYQSGFQSDAILFGLKFF